MRLAPAQIGERHQTRPPHGTAALRGPVIDDAPRNPEGFRVWAVCHTAPIPPLNVMNVSNLRNRSAIIKLIRQFFDSRDYTEMHTPRLVGLPGQEPYLEPFWTRLRQGSGGQAEMNVALITSPEYAMKRLLAAGFDRIYDLGPVFRNNEPWDGTHDPEFLMIEWYRKNADLSSLMDETEEMVRWVAASIGGRVGANLVFAPTSAGRTQGSPLPSFRRLTCADAWRMYANVDLPSLIGNREAMARVATEHGQIVTDTDKWDDLYYKIFLSEIEPKLGGEPTFLHRYPASQAALSKKCSDDPRFADRVELYMSGSALHPQGDGHTPVELANGFAELSDASEQRKRFEEDVALRESLGKKSWPLDESFLADLPKMGDAAGIAFGVERFVMLLTGAKSINDVVPFSARERFGG